MPLPESRLYDIFTSDVPTFEPKKKGIRESYKFDVGAGVEQWSDLIDEHVKRYDNVDTDLVKAIMKQESGGNPEAGSPAGAKGLMQLMDETAQSLGVSDSFDPEQNVQGGVQLLSFLADKYGDDTEKILAAYNGGELGVDQAVEKYGDDWLSHLHEFKGTNPRTGKNHAEETWDYIERISDTLGKPVTAPAGGFKAVKQTSFERLSEIFGVEAPFEEPVVEEKPVEEKVTPPIEPEFEEPEKKPGFFKRLAKIFGIKEKEPEVEEPKLTGEQIFEKATKEKRDLTPEEQQIVFGEIEPIFTRVVPGTTPEEMQEIQEFKAKPEPPLMDPDEYKKLAEVLVETGNESLIGKLATKSAAFGRGFLENVPGVEAILGEKFKSVQAQVLKEKEPVAVTAGGVAAFITQAMAGGQGVAATLSKLGISKSPLLMSALTRTITSGTITGSQQEWNEDFTRSLQNTLQGAGAGLVSVVPEVLGPANAWQLMLQPMADLIYDVGVGKIRGENVGSKEWWQQEAINLAMAEGFAIRDVSSGKAFKLEQKLMREDMGKLGSFLKGSGDKGFEIFMPGAKERIETITKEGLKAGGILTIEAVRKGEVPEPVKPVFEPKEIPKKIKKQIVPEEELAKLPEPSPEELKRMEEIKKAPLAPPIEGVTKPKITLDIDVAGTGKVDYIKSKEEPESELARKTTKLKEKSLQNISEADRNAIRADRKSAAKDAESYLTNFEGEVARLEADKAEKEYTQKLFNDLRSEIQTTKKATDEGTLQWNLLIDAEKGFKAKVRSEKVEKQLQAIAGYFNIIKRDGPGAVERLAPPENVLNEHDNWDADAVADLIQRSGMTKTDLKKYKVDWNAQRRALNKEYDKAMDEFNAIGKALDKKEAELGVKRPSRFREPVEAKRFREIKEEPDERPIQEGEEFPESATDFPFGANVKESVESTEGAEVPITKAGFLRLPTGKFVSKKQKVPEPYRAEHERYVSEKQTMLLESDKFTNELVRDLKKKEREITPFLIEETDVPKELGRPDLVKAFEDPEVSAKVTKKKKKIKAHLKKSWDYMQEHLPDMSAKEIENYVTHIWDIPKNKVKDTVKWFATRNPFLKKRFIETYKAGIQKGLKPKTLDIAKIINIHDQYVIKTTENVRLVQALSKMQDEEGVRLIQRADKAPDGWITADHPVLRRALYKPGEPAKIIKVPVKYHPDLKPLMDSVFGERIDFTPVQVYEAVNAFQKKLQLSISLFHHAALSETAVATLGPIKTAKIMLNVKGLYNALARNRYDIYEKKFEVAKDGVKHGLQLGAITDVHRNMVNDMLERVETSLNKVHKGLGLPVKAVKKANQMWDKALWDYLHNSFKVYGYESLSAKAIGKLKNATDADIARTKKEVAQFMNDTFGGQNWERMMTNPKTLQIAQWSLLSPDWTLSTVRQGFAPTGLGAISKETRGLRRKMGVNFWAKAILYFYGGINLLNYALTKHDDAEEKGKSFKSGKGVWMFENDPGHKTHLFVGRYPDGSKRYIRWGKQFREIPELFYDQSAGQISPITATKRKLGSKLAPNLQLGSTLFTGVSLGGFKNRKLADKAGWSWFGAAAREIVKAPLPFALKNTMNESKQFKITDLAFPSSKGMTHYKARKLFKAAIVKRKESFIAAIYKAAVENKLNADDIFADAIRDLKAEATRELGRKIRSGRITEPRTWREEKYFTREMIKKEEKVAILEDWESMLLMAEERYQDYLLEIEEQEMLKGL